MARRTAVQDRPSALSFNGTSDYVALNGDAFSLSTIYTFWAWCTPTTKSGDRVIFSQPPGGLMVGLATAGFLNWLDSDVGANTVPMTITANERMFLSFTIDPATMTTRVFKNGVYVGQGTAPGTLINSGITSIGRYSGGNRYFEGRIEEAGIAAVGISDSQHADMYLTSWRPGPKLLWYEMEPGAGNELYDRGDHGSNGTINGAQWKLNNVRGRTMVQPFQHASMTGWGFSPNDSIDTNASGAGSVIGRMKILGFVGDTVFGLYGNVADDAWRFNIESATGYPFIWTVNSGGSGQTVPKVLSPFPLKQWIDYMVVFMNNGTTVTGEVYLNGVLFGTQSATRNVRTCSRFHIANTQWYRHADVAVYDRRVTPREYAEYHTTGLVPPGAKIHYPADEGTGHMLYDRSGNGYDLSGGVISWTEDVPAKQKVRVGDNMIPNGDFNIVPIGNAATASVNNRVIDGTSGGSSMGTEDVFTSVEMKIFKWKVNAYTVTSPAAVYDKANGYDGRPSAMKLSGVQIKERVNITLGQRIYGDLNGANDIRNNLIKVDPNTSYTFTATMKADVANKVGTLPSYFEAVVYEHSSTGFTVQNRIDTVWGNTSFGWTTKSINFVTNNSTRYVNIFAAIVGNGSNYADITAWIGRLDLRPTSAVPRKKVLNHHASLYADNVATPDSALLDVAANNITIAVTQRFGNGSDNLIFRFRDASNLEAFRANVESNTNKISTTVTNSGGVGVLGFKTANSIDRNRWYRLLFTINKTTGLTQIAVAGTVVGSGGSNIPRSTVRLSIYGATNNGGTYQKDVKVWNRILTPDEIAADAAGDDVATPVLNWELDEGAGNVAYDKSGNNLNGTISSGTWSAEVPSPARKAFDSNLVPNGDNKYVPPFTAATTTNQRWVNGLAAGDTSNDCGKLFGFPVTTKGGSAQASFDATEPTYPNARLIETTAVASFIESHMTRIDTDAHRLTASRDGLLVPVTPGVPYTLTFKARTQYVSGDSGDGAFVVIWGVSGAGIVVETLSPSPFNAVKTSTAWATYTKTFTPGANTRFVSINRGIYGHTGAGTLIMKAWFTDMVVGPTFNTTGVAA